MGWIQRMQRARVRKKRRKLEYKIKRSYGSANKTAKYQRKLDALNAKFPPYSSKSSAAMQSTPSSSHSAPATSASATSYVSKQPTGFEREFAYRQQELKTQKTMVTDSQKADAYSARNVTTTAQTVTMPTANTSKAPTIPANNRFAAHEALISRIARRAAQSCARWIRNKSKWEPLNNGYSAEYYVEITVRKDGIDFNKLAYENLNSISFKSLGMADIPEAQTDAFLHALKPFLDAYFPEEINKAFSNISPLIKRTTSVTYGKLNDGWDSNYNDIYRKSIIVSMRYTNPPAPKLKSW